MKTKMMLTGSSRFCRNSTSLCCDNKDNEEPVYGNQGVVGDQLTVERAINGHMSLSNGFTAEERIEGLHFEVADWHAGNKFLEVCHSLINHAGVGGSRLI